MTATRPDVGLMRAIIAAPDDDAPRLVYADWLDEHEQPERAEFIRVQCELAKLTRLDGTIIKESRWVEYFCRRERELLEGHGRLWARDVANLVNPMAPIIGNELHWMGNVILKWEWSRGFIAEVTLPTLAFCGGPCERCIHGGNPELNDPRCPRCAGTGRVPGCAATLFACQPVTRVTLSDCEPFSTLWRIEDFTWFRGPGVQDSFSDLPGELFDKLKGQVGGTNQQGQQWKSYITCAAALDALSSGAVAWGREQAGLTPREGDQRP